MTNSLNLKKLIMCGLANFEGKKMALSIFATFQYKSNLIS